MSKPIDLNKLNAKLDLLLALMGDIDMDVFEIKNELRKKNGPAGLTPQRGLITELLAN